MRAKIYRSKRGRGPRFESEQAHKKSIKKLNQLIENQSKMQSDFLWHPDPLGVAIGTLLAVLSLGAGSYIYTSLALMTIAKKLSHPRPWLAWIPFANTALILQMGGFHWAWVFLFLVPFAGWTVLIALSTISMWRVFEKRNYPGALALFQLGGFIPYISLLLTLTFLILLGFVAWKDRTAELGQPSSTSNKSKPKTKKDRLNFLKKRLAKWYPAPIPAPAPGSPSRPIAASRRQKNQKKRK